ncbi:MAG: hypothetical protein LBK99_25650 [Opitutaceae bacterium]|nr:hypothetical protein [Opitutaceae bacterium]
MPPKNDIWLPSAIFNLPHFLASAAHFALRPATTNHHINIYRYVYLHPSQFSLGCALLFANT